MKKKIALLVLSGLMAAALSACGSSASSSKADSAAASTAADTAAETADPAATDAEADAVWPSTKTVEIYVPFKAGGNSDLCARVFAEALTAKTGTNFVVVNQSEGGGAVCYNTVANAEKDGSVLGWVTPSWFTSYFAGTHDLNPVENFSTLALTEALTGQYLIVPKNSPFDTLDDLVNYCKENPDTLVLGMQLGSASHYYAESCAKSLGITWNYVENGSDADRITAILGNVVEATTINGAAAQEYVAAGEVKCLAVLSTVGDNAPDELKDVPSLKDCGYEDISVSNCNFLFGPEMDETLCKEINSVFTEVFNSEEVQQKLKDLNQAQEICGSYEETQEKMTTLYDSYHGVAEGLGILAGGR